MPWNARALLLYLLAAVVATWPVAAHLTDRLWVGRFDVWITAWLLGWLHTSLADGTLGLHCDAVFYPLGKSVLVFGHLGLQLLGSALVPLLGIAGAYNVLLLAALTLSAFAAYALVHELVEDRGAALVAGLLFGFSPWVLLEASVGSLEHACAGVLPLGVLGLVRMQRSPGRGPIALTAGATVLAALISWYFAIFLALAGALFTAAHLRDRGYLRRAAVAVAVVLALAVPLALAVYPAATRPRPPLTPDLLQERAALRDFVDGRLALQDLAPDALDRYAAAEVYFNGYSPANQFQPERPTDPLNGRIASVLLYAALVGALTAGRRGIFWLVLSLVFGVLAIGPALRVGEFTEGTLHAVGLPYTAFYNATELLRQAFRPYRFLVMADLGLVVLAGYGLAWLARRPGNAFHAAAFVAVLAARWIVPDYPPVRLESAEPPPYYRELAQIPGRFALLELPFYAIPSTAAQTRYVYYQAVHGKPILNDHFVRTTELLRLQELVRGNTALAAFMGPSAWPPPVRDADLQWFVDQGFRQVNLHTWFEEELGAEEPQMRIEALHVLLVHLFGRPEVHDGIEVFPVALRPRGEWPRLPFRQAYESLRPAPGQARIHAVLPGHRAVSFWALCPTAAPLKVGTQEVPVRAGCWNWVRVAHQGPLVVEGPTELRRVCAWSEEP